MSMQIRFEAWLRLLSLLVGCWLMLVYDLLRVLRLMIKHSSFVMGIEDFFYWIYAAVMTFLLLFYENSGIVRAYIIACVFFGMIFYDKIISRNVFQLLKKLKKWYKIKR